MIFFRNYKIFEKKNVNFESFFRKFRDFEKSVVVDELNILKNTIYLGFLGTIMGPRPSII